MHREECYPPKRRVKTEMPAIQLAIKLTLIGTLAGIVGCTPKPIPRTTVQVYWVSEGAFDAKLLRDRASQIAMPFSTAPPCPEFQVYPEVTLVRLDKSIEPGKMQVIGQSYDQYVKAQNAGKQFFRFKPKLEAVREEFAKALISQKFDPSYFPEVKSDYDSKKALLDLMGKNSPIAIFIDAKALYSLEEINSINPTQKPKFKKIEDGRTFWEVASKDLCANVWKDKGTTVTLLLLERGAGKGFINEINPKSEAEVVTPTATSAASSPIADKAIPASAPIVAGTNPAASPAISNTNPVRPLEKPTRKKREQSPFSNPEATQSPAAKPATAPKESEIAKTSSSGPKPGAAQDCSALIQELEASLRRKNWEGRSKPWTLMAGLLKNAECSAAERVKYLEICETQIRPLYKEESTKFVCQ